MRMIMVRSTFVLVCLLLTRGAIAGPRVDVVIGEKAPALERLAAEELSGQFRRLFDAEVKIADKAPAEFTHLIYLGNPDSNPAIRSVLPAWPKLSDQGQLLRSVKGGKGSALVVGGGSPVATLWAVYELGYRFGIRYMLFGDLFPIAAPPLKFDGIEVLLEPSLRVRTWRTVNDFPIGPESWGLAEQERVLRQVAKLKFNRVMLAFYPWQAYVDYEFNGVKKETGISWFGFRYPVDGDTAGRSVFRGAKVFENPDFAGKTTYAERVAAATHLARGVMGLAHQLGMSTGVSISPLEFPKEFAKALPGSRQLYGLEQLTIGPGAAQRTDDATLMGLVKAQIRGYMTAYPDLDFIYLSLPEFPEWSEQADVAWKEIDARTGISKSTSLDKLTAAARDRKLIASGARGVQSLRGNVTALEFFNRLLADRDLLRSPSGHTAQAILTDIDPALFPILDRILPSGTATSNFVDYTARRVAENRDLLKQIPARSVPSSLILTLADDNLGVVPQMSYTALHTLVESLRANGWDGFSTRYWVVGDLDFPANYLSRASFSPGITPREVLDDLLTPVIGTGTAERTMKAFDLVEQATNLIDEHDLGLSFPVPNMVTKYYVGSDPVPAWWEKVTELYLAATDEMYRVNTRSREGDRDFSLYLARRFEFGAQYMLAITATRKAAIARAKSDRETQTAELEKAVDAMYTALGALGAVARSNSDRGVIAVVNEYGYRPLKKELDEQ